MAEAGLRSQRGFTLIEAMVAMVIFGAAGMALFTWVNASVVSLRRAEDANARSAAMGNAIEFMQSVNPMQTPDGKFSFGPYRLEWQAQASMPPIDGSGHTLGLSNFQLALYDTQVKVYRQDNSFWFDFNLKQVGFKKVRGTVNPFQP